MSDNDVISRTALYEKTAEWEAQALHMVELHLHDDDQAAWRKWSTVLAERAAFKYDVADAPAVPREMTAREFVKHYSRMCHTINRCTQCPIFAEATKENPIKSCWFWVRDNTEKAVSIVEQWAAEHPDSEMEDADE